MNDHLKNNQEKHNNYLSEIYSGYSEIAASNEDGWIEKAIDKENIKTESKKNVKQAFPYNKYHCTSWNVNQACAIIICSEDVADKLDIPSNKRVYPLASSENNHMITTLQRPNLIEPAGMHLAANFILNICNKNNLIPNLYDLYSCFPVAIQMFAKSLNLNDIKDKTITGAMPFAGGPLNSYVLHSTAKLIEKLRENKNWLDIPVVVITAKDLTKDDHNRLKGNVEAIMQKGSYSRQDLLAEVGTRIKKLKECLKTNF